MNAPIFTLDGAPVGTENDPNTTPPAANRIFDLGSAAGPPYFIAETDNATLELWVRPYGSGRWLRISVGGTNTFLVGQDELLVIAAPGVVPRNTQAFLRVQGAGAALTRVAFGFCAPGVAR